MIRIGEQGIKDMRLGEDGIDAVYVNDSLLWKRWQTWWRTEQTLGFFIESNTSKRILTSSGVRMRSIVFKVRPNKSYKVSKDVRTTMRIGFVRNLDERTLLSAPVYATNALEISATSDEEAGYCVCQLVINAEISDPGYTGSGSLTWEQITNGLSITQSEGNLFYPTIVSEYYHDANGNVTTTTGRQNRFMQVQGGIFVTARKRLLFTWDSLITGAVKPAFRVTFFTEDGTFIPPRTLMQLTVSDPTEWICTVPDNASRMYVEVDDVSNTAHVGFNNFRIYRL